MFPSRPLATVVLSSLLIAACSKGESPASETTPTQPMSTAGETTVVAEPAAPPVTPPEPTPAPVEDTPAPTPLTDPQIVKVLAAVDSGEIDQAKIAQKKSKNQRVKKFAQQMIQHHTKAKQKGTTLAKKAKITPEDTPIAAQLTGAATTQLEALKAADAASFDTLYMQGQVQQHQQVLDMVNAQLIPGASDTGLKEHLAEARTMVEGHLTEAQAIVQELSASASPAAAGADVSGAGSAPTTMQ